VTRRQGPAGQDLPAPEASTDDDTGRLVAQQLSREGDWLVLWGPWSRQWWAFPRFLGGTVVHGGDRDELIRSMRMVAMQAWRPVGRGG
jgi:hypothetical protein